MSVFSLLLHCAVVLLRLCTVPVVVAAVDSVTVRAGHSGVGVSVGSHCVVGLTVAAVTAFHAVVALSQCLARWLPNEIVVGAHALCVHCG